MNPIDIKISIKNIKNLYSRMTENETSSAELRKDDSDLLDG